MAVLLIFIAVALAFVFGGHYLLYRLTAGFFGISGRWRKIMLGSLFVLAAWFLASMVLVRIRPGFLTKIFYIFGSVWIGVFAGLLTVALILWIIKLVLTAVGARLNWRALAGAVLSLAVLYSGFGIWSAFHPRVKEISVPLKNLPAQWRDAKIVQLSDVHLGDIHGPDFMRQVAEKTNAQDPDLILITGDLFDGTDGDMGAFVEPLRQLQAKKGVYFVTGNHETYLGLSDAYLILNKADIRILNDEMTELDGLQLVGISYPRREDASSITGGAKNTLEIVKSLAGFDPGKPSILLHHAPTNIAEAKEAGISFQLSGHAHKGQIWPISLVTRAVYGKYHYGLHTEGDFSIYTTNGAGTWGPPMRTGNRPEIV